MPTTPKKYWPISWDWRDQLDPAELNKGIKAGYHHWAFADTGDDTCHLIGSTEPISNQSATRIYNRMMREGS